MMERHLYSVKYRQLDDPKGRIHRLTVVAKDADEAREYARIRDVRFGSTVTSPKRRGTVEPEQADPITAAKAREFVTVDGGRHGDIEVEWVDR